jgi:exonuclease VII small subunit
MDSSWEKQPGFSISSKKLGVLGLGVLICVGGVMVATNPSQAAYEAFATQQLVTYLDQEACAKVPTAFNLKQECRSLLQSNRPQIQKIIADSTQQRNFVFFSVYTTELSVTSFLPKYRVLTLGVFDQFLIYDTMQE